MDENEVKDIDYAKQIADKGYYSFFKDFYKKPDLVDEEKTLKRQRSLALLGDLAKVGTQAFASSKGARQFKPVESQVPYYTDQLSKLRGAKRAIDQQYQDKSLSAIFQDFDKKRQDDALANQYAQQMRIAQAKVEADAAKAAQGHVNALELEGVKAGNAASLEATKHKNRTQQIQTKGAIDAKNGKGTGKELPIRESVQGKDGAVWTRTTTLSSQEARAFVEMYGTGVKRERNQWDPQIDYAGQFSQLVKSGIIPDAILEASGFIQTKQAEHPYDPSKYRGAAYNTQPPQQQELPPLD